MAWCFGRVPHQHFSRLANSNVVVSVIDNAHFKTGLRTPDCAFIDVARLVMCQEHATALCHRPPFDQWEAEAFLERAMHRRLNATAHTELDFVVTILWSGRLTEEDRNNGSQIVDDCCLSLSDLTPPPSATEPFGQDLAIACLQHSEERKNACINMEQRQRVIDALCTLQHRHEATARCVPLADHQFIFVTEDATLWPACCPGRIEQARLRLW